MTTTPTTTEIVPGAFAAVSKAPPDESTTRTRVDRILRFARALQVRSREEEEAAVEQLRQIRTLSDDLDEQRKSFVQPLNQVVDRINAQFMPYIKALRGPGPDSAEAIIKGSVLAWRQAEEERVRKEREQAEKAADAERQALLAKAEQQRAAANAVDAAPEVREAAAQAAEALEQTAQVVTAPVVAAPKAAGGSLTRKTLDWEVTNKAEFIAYLVKNDLLDVVIFDQIKLRALAQLRGQQTEIPGLRVFHKTGLAVRK